MKTFNQNIKWIKSDDGYGSEGAYCPNGFEVDYKQNQYISQVSSVPLCPVFFYTEEPEKSRFFIPKICLPQYKRMRTPKPAREEEHLWNERRLVKMR
jgi:hypothetical protein